MRESFVVVKTTFSANDANATDGEIRSCTIVAVRRSCCFCEFCACDEIGVNTVDSTDIGDGLVCTCNVIESVGYGECSTKPLLCDLPLCSEGYPTYWQLSYEFVIALFVFSLLTRRMELRFTGCCG